jgi:hypothetical protein
MTLRWRDTLLFSPVLVIGISVALETAVQGAWSESAPFVMAPLSALPIIAYLWLERRGLFPTTSHAKGIGGARDQSATSSKT